MIGCIGNLSEVEFVYTLDGQKQTLDRKGILRILSIIPAIAGIVAFILTEDITQKPQLVDKWTILMAVILAVNVVITIFSLKKYNDGDENADAEGAEA